MSMHDVEYATEVLVEAVVGTQISNEAKRAALMQLFEAEDRCDVGFLNFPIPEDEGVVVRQTITLLNDVFIGGKGFERFRGRVVPLWELQSEPLLLMEPHTVARSAVDHFCTSLGIRFRPAIEVDSWGFMKKLVAEGMGIGAFTIGGGGAAQECKPVVCPPSLSRSVSGMISYKTSAATTRLRSFHKINFEFLIGKDYFLFASSLFFSSFNFSCISR